ncbi:hypothetical protein Rsub_02427 [Raphidocelis subcapitata]|uniref:t-SNARE coiled-coil homology domain-containing protein n=1 Tax=Raphidocelis subcapitata TaxID=307507 RepID=A0A2V0NRR2_9CHLO|nr:hypothetical protein Rsub_02427 [Raphidocelis subcapitata]|eukprot:GBF90321.1 hypothetical protein Rsub_02427 [Raphidocelis subcapitata]
MAAPRPRMQYGAQPAAGYGYDEAPARQELFAGAEGQRGGAPGGGPGGASALAAPRAPAAPQGRPQPTRAELQQMDNRQVLEHAVDTHKDTTATARRALQVVEQTKELQASTMVALKDQGQQMQRVAAGMDKIGSDVTYSQRILRYMSMCCCFSFFCSCCTEPDRNEGDHAWRGSGGPPPPPRGPPRAAAPGAAPAAARGQGHGRRGQQPPAPPPRPEWAPVTTAGLDKAGYGEQAAVIREETRQQDAYLDQISHGLEQLKAGALVMHEEISSQDQGVSRLQADAHVLHGRLATVNREGFRRV